MDDLHEWLLRTLDQSFDARAWHGPNLLSSIRGLSADQAAWRPDPERHSIWELTLHCAYWKHRVHDRVAKDRPEQFPFPGKDWPSEPEDRTEASWKRTRSVLTKMHAGLRVAAESLAPAELREPGPRQERSRLENLIGVAQHDVYHAGQIRLLRRLGEGASW